MRIREVLIRWYKSFNYDYELKANVNAERLPWQLTTDGWLPHVRIDLEHDITAVVGANESGKSHLLDAITIVLTGEGLSQNDFCRYSTLFSVEKGERRFPEVGAVFELTDDDKTGLTALGVPLRANGDLLMLRPEPARIDVLDANDQLVTLDDGAAKGLQALLPRAFLLNTQVELPDSVSIAALAQAGTPMVSRQRRYELLRFLFSIGAESEVAPKASALFALLGAADRIESEERQLGRVLLTKVARIEASAFRDLQDAIENEREGLVNALIQEMNKSLARHLNISKWWSQDADFQLRVSPRSLNLSSPSVTALERTTRLASAAAA